MMLNKFQMSIQQLQEKVRGQEEVGQGCISNESYTVHIYMYYKKFSLLEILIPFDKVYKVWNILVMNLKSFTNIKI